MRKCTAQEDSHAAPPVEVQALRKLPAWLQPVALALPPTYVFEGLRALVVSQTFEAGHMIKALLLNAVYFALGAAAFAFFLRQARAGGSLVQMGE